ncbi:MAG: Sulfate/thiosulfate import ATP-binding protein CysA [Syntrophorhabdus sp. PtaU1.Bin058]|nr:MAG: Sulfate/thiosulfate import ATP-binding protein CysA [Syntrophorhabdus sp. PtaU1.Bin058]
MNQTMPILEAKNLSVERAGTTLLDVPHLDVEDGEVLSLIGPNGAGKTTLLVTLCHLFKYFSGTILFKGRQVGNGLSAGQYRQKIAMVFQEPLLFNTTVFENVAAGLRFRKAPRLEIEEAVKENLERFGIGHLADRSARTLSGGEAQRTSLARAFAVKPDMLFLDEPFSSLDPPTRESLINDLEKILDGSGTTTIFATHDRIEALRLSDRIAVMNKGRILQVGAPDDVMNHPADEFVASFVGVETILKGKVIERRMGIVMVSVSGREIAVIGEHDIGDSITLCIRPENVTLSINPSKTPTSARNTFPGTIERIVPMGLFQKVELDCGFPLVAYVTHDSVGELSLCEGADVAASLKATAIHVVKK